MAGLLQGTVRAISVSYIRANGRSWRKAAARFECDRRDDAVAIIFMNMIDKSMRL